jgi:hypothetical protein
MYAAADSDIGRCSFDTGHADASTDADGDSTLAGSDCVTGCSHS